MSVYIKGMEMPDYGYVCLKVFANGEVLMTKEHRGALVITGINERVGTAVPVPPHGDLIDRHDLKYKKITFDYDEWDDTFDDGLLFVTDLIDNAPTIIPAEEGEG